MAKLVRAFALFGIVALALPGAAFAGDTPSPTTIVPQWLPLAGSGLGLLVAVLLLVAALQVRKSVVGGVIAEKMYYVVLAIVCLGSTALLHWVVNFLPDQVSVDEALFAAQLLVVVAMALLAAYFYSVNHAMKRYVSALTGAQLLDNEAKAPQTPGDVSGGEG